MSCVASWTFFLTSHLPYTHYAVSYFRIETYLDCKNSTIEIKSTKKIASAFFKFWANVQSSIISCPKWQDHKHNLAFFFFFWSKKDVLIFQTTNHKRKWRTLTLCGIQHPKPSFKMLQSFVVVLKRPFTFNRSEIIEADT